MIRFGVFEADRKTGELRKAGLRVKLADQPFRLLIALLERPGELVTREELRKLLWLDDCAGNFEQGLNRAVNKLRTALSDSAALPRYIETLPGYGYRFMGVVDREPTGGSIFPPRSPWIPVGLVAAGLVAAAVAYSVWQLVPPPLPDLRWRKLTTDNFNKFGPALNDGTRIYFLASYGSESFLAQIPVRGGQPSRLPITLPGPTCSLQDLSPDGQEILLTAGVVKDRTRTLPLWTLQIAEETARRLDVLPATSAAYSPTDGTIAFTTESALWVIPHHGPPRRLVELRDSILNSVSWDRRGQVIAFSRQNPLSAQTAAWEVRQDGTRLRPVIAAWQAKNHLPIGWVPDRPLELFAADGGFWARREASPPFRQADAVPTKLTESEPEFSDRVRLRSGGSFTAIGVDRLGEMQRFDAGENEWKPLLDGISAEAAEFSPDRKRVAYVTYPQQTLWVRDADGRQPIQLTSPPVIARYPHWSPDGKRLAFNAQERPDMPLRMFLVDADGSAVHLAVSSDAGSQGDPSWSPDGKHLAYGLDVRSARESAYIRIVDLNSGQVTKLPGSDGLFGPRWSPDGKMIAALERDGQGRLRLYRFDKNQWSTLSNGRADWPSWNRTSTAILFRAGDALNETQVDTGRVHRIVSLKNEEIGGFTHAIGRAKDDAPTRTLNRDGRQIYELYFQHR